MSKSNQYTEDYDLLDTDNKLVMNLRDLGHVIRFLFEGKGSQKRILIILYKAGSMTQRKLTEKLGVKPGSASEVIGKLEIAGLIQRTQSDDDRRTSEVRLTDAGREKAYEAVQQRKQRHREMFSVLSVEEKETLLALTEKLTTDWHSRYRDYDKRLICSDGHGKKHGCSGKFNRY